MRFRLAEKRDFDTCKTLLHPGLRLSQRVRSRLAEIWEELLVVGPSGCVVEDPSLPYPEALQGFGVSAFVRNSFVDELLATTKLARLLEAYAEELGIELEGYGS